MDRLSEQLHRYLQLAHSSTLLVSHADKANINALIAMLGSIDKDIIDSYYGLFNAPLLSAQQLAFKYHVPEAAIHEIIDKDLHRLAITPEWQIMVRQMRPIVQKKIGFNK